ncbi:hypothetical protein A1Q2_02187 [Trichosporon asahii var. asahii CBS 8904]|uniref:Uncharacterized protein n=1 Tax=Trichosporon asahii var. asahii (strain CBS 8904) TaxID=1220162 RepID=K1WQZ8_TRIAC|nr:hypothetical protein A1Q2_02187 [Trichosporon asahii var. asahii CBS 8904]
MSVKRQWPLELITLVASDTSPSAQAALCRTSKSVNDAVTPLLYRNLVITRANADRLFLGLPRKAKAKNFRITKAEFDKEIEEMREKFADIWAQGDDLYLDGRGWQSFDYEESDPETDDELIPDLDTIKKETDAVTWERRKELFKHVRRVTFAQVPSESFLTDLMDHLGLPECFDSDDEFNDGEDEEPPTPLFPSLTHLSFSSRVIRYVTDWASVNFYQSETVHMIPRLVRSSRFGRPTHACITMPNGRDLPEFFRRMIKRNVNNIDEQIINDFGNELMESWSVVTSDPSSALTCYLPPSIKTFSVHDLRDVGVAYELHARQGTTDAGYGVPIPFRSDSPVTHKVFYNRGPRTKTDELAPAISWAVNRTSSKCSWEFIGKFPLKTIDEVRKKIKSDAYNAKLTAIDDGYFPFIPEDENPEAAAAVARAKRALEDAELALRQREVAAAQQYEDTLKAKVPELPARQAELQAAAAEARRKWEEARSGGTRQEMNALQQQMQLAENAAKGVGKAGAEIRGLWARAGIKVPREQYIKQKTTNHKATRDRAQSQLSTEQLRARESRKENARKRFAALPAPDPTTRVTFREFDEAEPCAVCGGGNVVDRDLNELLERAWSYRV